jgi:hypothetical protein
MELTTAKIPKGIINMTLRLKIVSAIDIIGCFPNADAIHGPFDACQASTDSRIAATAHPRAPVPVSGRTLPGTGPAKARRAAGPGGRAPAGQPKTGLLDDF